MNKSTTDILTELCPAKVMHSGLLVKRCMNNNNNNTILKNYYCYNSNNYYYYYYHYYQYYYTNMLFISLFIMNMSFCPLA